MLPKRLRLARRSLGASLGLSLLLIALGIGSVVLATQQADLELRRSIAAVSDRLAARYAQGGPAALLAEIEPLKPLGFHIGLRSSDKRILADESLHSPRRVGWIQYTQAHTTYVVLVRQLPSGAVYSVAHEAPSVGAAVIMGWIVAAIGLLFAVTAFLIATRFDRLTARALDGISASLDRVTKGDFLERLPEDSAVGALDEASARVNSALAELQRRDDEMRSGLNALAHEMRTPLAHVAQWLEIIGDPDTTAAERKNALRQAGARIDFVLRSYDSILRLAHLQSRREETLVPVDLQAEASNVASAFDAAFEQSGRRLVVDCRPAWAAADSQLIAIAVSTLLENVLAHTPAGVIAVVSTWSVNGHSYLRVADNGPGLSAEEMASAVERFQRGPKSRGLGLGLTVVEAIARAGGATLTLADAEPGLSVTLHFSGTPRPSGIHQTGSATGVIESHPGNQQMRQSWKPAEPPPSDSSAPPLESRAVPAAP